MHILSHRNCFEYITYFSLYKISVYSPHLDSAVKLLNGLPTGSLRVTLSAHCFIWPLRCVLNVWTWIRHVLLVPHILYHSLFLKLFHSSHLCNFPSPFKHLFLISDLNYRQEGLHSSALKHSFKASLLTLESSRIFANKG